MGFVTSKVLLSRSYGLSLSDQYWICSKTQNLNWSDINFFDNTFFEDVDNLLFGNFKYANGFIKKLNLISSDNTADGLVKKK